MEDEEHATEAHLVNTQSILRSFWTEKPIIEGQESLHVGNLRNSAFSAESAAAARKQEARTA